MERISGVYEIKNTVNGKVYIGSSRDMGYRWDCHRYGLSMGIHYNPHLQNAWCKYGESVFVFDVLEEVSDESQLRDREQFWLDEAQACKSDRGYNVARDTANSFEGHVLSEESRRRMSESHKGEKNHNWGRVFSEETRERMSRAKKGRKLSPRECKRRSESTRGEKNPNFGKKASSETRLKMSEKARKRSQSPEFRERMSQLHKDRVHTEEHRRKNSESVRERWQDLEFRARMEKKRRERTTPEYRSRASVQMKEKWQDPKFREMMLTARRESKSHKNALSTQVPASA